MEENLEIYVDEDDEDLLVSQLNTDITNQYVVFSVDNEEYGLPILAVQEIISLPEITKIPNAPDYIPGIINLRGKVIPLYKLRTRFLAEEKDLTENSIVIVIQTGIEKTETVGFIVDSVSDVVSIMDEDFQKAPEFSNTSHGNFIEKIGHLGSRIIIIIDMEKFFSEKEKVLLADTVNENS